MLKPEASLVSSLDHRLARRLRYEIDPRWQGDISRTLLLACDASITVIEEPADLAILGTWLDGQRSLNK